MLRIADIIEVKEDIVIGNIVTQEEIYIKKGTKVEIKSLQFGEICSGNNVGVVIRLKDIFPKIEVSEGYNLTNISNNILNKIDCVSKIKDKIGKDKLEEIIDNIEMLLIDYFL